MSRRRRPRRPAVTAALVVVVAVAAGVMVSLQQRADRAPTGSPADRPPSAVATPRPDGRGPAPATEPRPRRAPLPAVRSTEPPLARVAIVFDDAGGSLPDVEAIIAIGRPVAVAVLPGLAHSAEVARRARAAGLEVLLHLPVEPEGEEKAMGPGAVTAAMSEFEIHAAVRAGLASVPGAIGVNNHMGSKGTADRRLVRAILEVVKQERLFFLDSRTTVHTVVEAVAAELGVPTARRAVFLDNDEDVEAIRGQVRRLIVLAKERGAAIAIGHAQRITPRVLAEMLGELDRERIAIVPVSALVRHADAVTTR